MNYLSFGVHYILTILTLKMDSVSCISTFMWSVQLWFMYLRVNLAHLFCGFSPCRFFSSLCLILFYSFYSSCHSRVFTSVWMHLSRNSDLSLTRRATMSFNILNFICKLNIQFGITGNHMKIS